MDSVTRHREELPSLTGLRGIAAVAVVLYHAQMLRTGIMVGPGIGRAYLAVDLFFLLSGFVLTHVYGAKISASPRREIGPFFWARAAKIYPVHLATLVALLPLYGSAPQFSGTMLGLNLLLLQGPWGPPSWNGPAWSISAEWHAYLLFPLLALRLARADRGSMITLGVLCLIPLCFLELRGVGNVTNGPAVLARAIPEFLIGMLIYRAYAKGWARAILSRDTVALGLVASIAALSVAPQTDALIILLLALLLLSIAYNRGGLSAILGSRSVAYLGRISYSLYMAQELPAFLLLAARPWLVSHGLPAAIIPALFLAMAFPLGAVTSAWIEYPARNWLRAKAHVCSLRMPHRRLRHESEAQPIDASALVRPEHGQAQHQVNERA